MSLFEKISDFLGISAPAPPPQRGLIESLVSWLGRGLIVFAVLIVLAVVCWTLFKHYVLRSLARTIRPEYRDLVTAVRHIFSEQHIRHDQPQTNSESSVQNFRSTETGCPICLLDPAELPVQTNCGHVFCGNCVVEYWHQGSWAGSEVKCPVCRQRVTLLMRDMRPGAVVPEDPDRALVVETEIRKYNRRFSGEPRSFLEKMYDLPGLLRHFWRNFTVTEGLGLLFHGRIIIMISAFILYFLMPFDLLPESLLGVFGLVDDLAAFGILAAQVAAMWRAFIVREDAAPARNQHRPPHSDRREGFRAQ